MSYLSVACVPTPHLHGLLACEYLPVLLLQDPAKYVGALAEAGASSMTFQIEPFLHGMSGVAAAFALAQDIHERGMRAAVALAPATPVSAVAELLDKGAVDMVSTLLCTRISLSCT